MTRYTSQPQAPAPAEPFMVESRIPIGESRLTTHVIVPIAQALCTMCLIGVTLLLWEWRPVAGVIGAVGLIVFAWRILLGDRLLWRLETITGRELDGIPGIGKPGPPTLLNPGESRRDVSQQETRTSDVPRMKEFVTRCFYEGTSEGAQHIKPNTAERDNYVECRDALLALGLAHWRNEANHSAGWDVVLDIEKTLAKVEKHVR
jgi:hypothetical protein